MGGQQCVKARGPAHPVDRGTQWVTDRRVPRGVQGHGLVDGGGTALRQRELQELCGTQLGEMVTGPGDRPLHCGAGRQTDTNAGVAGAAAQPHGVRGAGACADMGQVVAVQLPVAVHSRVGDGAVECGLDLDVTGPVLGRELGAQGRQMRLCHVYEAQLPRVGPAPLGILVPHMPLQGAGVQVQGQPVVEERHGVRGEPRCGVVPRPRTESQRHQLGRLTISSFSTRRPATSDVRRL